MGRACVQRELDRLGGLGNTNLLKFNKSKRKSVFGKEQALVMWAGE